MNNAVTESPTIRLKVVQNVSRFDFQGNLQNLIWLPLRVQFGLIKIDNQARKERLKLKQCGQVSTSLGILPSPLAFVSMVQVGRSSPR